jgi:hypothetical protein
MYWTTGSGRIDLKLTKKQAGIGSHSGESQPDVEYLRTIPAIKRQLAKIDPQILRDELSEYGAWDGNELSNHDMNLTRLLWIACGDIREEN